MQKQYLNDLISELLMFRAKTSRFANNRQGLGNSSKTFLGQDLKKSSIHLLSNLNPTFKENFAEYPNNKKEIKISNQTKEYIKNLETDPKRQEALINEIQKRAPFLSEKLNKAIGRASQADGLQMAQNTIEKEINKCRIIVSKRFSREQFLQSNITARNIGYRSRDVEATVNGKGTGINVSVYETRELDMKHQAMQTRYADMSNAQMNNYDTALNIGAITPAALLAVLFEKASINDYTLANKIGVVQHLKDYSLARFNNNQSGMSKIEFDIKNKLTEYIKMQNGYSQQISQSMEQNISQNHISRI